VKADRRARPATTGKTSKVVFSPRPLRLCASLFFPSWAGLAFSLQLLAFSDAFPMRWPAANAKVSQFQDTFMALREGEMSIEYVLMRERGRERGPTIGLSIGPHSLGIFA